MRISNVNCFCDLGEVIECDMYTDSRSNRYPIDVHFRSGPFERISIYMGSMRDLVNFKNSFLSTYEKLAREVEEERSEN